MIDPIFLLPPRFAIWQKVLGNDIQQLALRYPPVEGQLISFVRSKTQKGWLLRSQNLPTDILVVPPKFKLADDDQAVIEFPHASSTVRDLRQGRWLRPDVKTPRPKEFATIQDRVRRSWTNAFHFQEEDVSGNIIGLRRPQIGALHAIHAHWSISSEPATIVMPTGTGKTEVMLSALLTGGCRRVMILVPTDALRQQIAEKFVTLGVLREPDCPVLSPDAGYPLVAQLRRRPKSLGDVDAVFEKAHIIVTTSAIVSNIPTDLQQRMAEHCSDLFIDEAHHVAAPTWRAFKARFSEQRVLQFTATPFREDGKRLEGDIVYRYPLALAQKNRYFKPIRFRPVTVFDRQRSDREIAEAAVRCLRADTSGKHILMARVNSKQRAAEVFTLYEKYAEFHPVQLHTGLNDTARRTARQRLLDRQSRIVVCIDMLGEGFDLPELKIAAFHDIRKTLAVTLQLAGRFTRARDDLGDAIFIANVADLQVQKELRKLYSQDPDWNLLLPDLADRVVGEQIALQQFLNDFDALPPELPLGEIKSAFSTVAYDVPAGDWTPELFHEGIPGLAKREQVYHTLNKNRTVQVIVTARRVELPWIDSNTLFQWSWELYVLVWLAEYRLLLIHGSENKDTYAVLARAVAGNDATAVTGERVFRVFSGITRLVLQNVGLSEQLGRNVRYVGRLGANVSSALSDLQLGKTQKTVVAGGGYFGGSAVAMGASRRGRIWSFRRGNLLQLQHWYQHIGTRLCDTTIDPGTVLRGTLVPVATDQRPAVMPLSVAWPEALYDAPESAWTVTIDCRDYPLSELSLRLIDPSESGALMFGLMAGSSMNTETTATSQTTALIRFELQFFKLDEVMDYRIIDLDQTHATLRRGDKTEAHELVSYFDEHPPVIWFANGATLTGNLHVPLKADILPYPRDKIEAWDWTGVNIRNESQTAEKLPHTIQAHVIRKIIDSGHYQLIIDDDGSGEAADIVAIRFSEADVTMPIAVDLYHCKFSKGDNPGARIEDLYVICGQAQTCLDWMTSAERRTELFTNLLRRNERRIDRGQASRIDHGSAKQLYTVREMSYQQEVLFAVFIVQPGLSKAKASETQLQLLGVTDNHLTETFQLPFQVIASA